MMLNNTKNSLQGPQMSLSQKRHYYALYYRHANASFLKSDV
jgi:hypothetical protein